MKRLIALILAGMLLFTSCKKHDANVKTEVNEANENVVEKNDNEKKKLFGNLSELLKLEKPIQPEYKVEKLSVNVDGYAIETDFSNVMMQNDWHLENNVIREALLKDKFYIDYSMIMEQPFAIYENNQYTFSNSFVTTDSVLHLYHVIYLGMMEKLEQTTLRQKLIDMSKAMLESTLNDYNENENLREITARNAALFYTALRLLGEESGINVPQEVAAISDEEMNNISTLSNGTSAITGGEVDYSQFTVRGNYTKNFELQSYFLANMLYSQNQYKLMDVDGEINKNAIKAAVLMSRPLAIDESANKMWKEIYSPISFLVENSEDVTPLKLIEMVYEVTDDESFDIEKISDDKVIDELAEKIENFEKPEIFPEKGIFVALLPQRAVVDNKWLQQMIDTNPESKRPKASGLDVMALMGNEKAEDIILNDEQNLLWDDFKEVYENTKALVESRSDEEKRSNIYRSWLWVLEGYNEREDENYPDFMNNDKWELKDLNSALASWAQLKHDTILYSKQFGAEMGGFDPIETQHYVEPNVEIYRRLSWLCEYTLQNSDRFNLLDNEQKSRLNDFKDMVDFFERVSVRELQDETMSKEDNERLKVIGGEMENIFIAFYTPPEDEEQQFSVSPSERDMANVADIQRIGSNSVGLPEGYFLEVGSGNFSPICVIYRVNGRYYFGRGAVMNYYEFLSDHRMTDEEFRDRVPTYFNNPEEPLMPYFIDSLYINYR